MAGIIDAADIVSYRAKQCWECPFYDGGTYCPYYKRTLQDNFPQDIAEQKPEWCRITNIKIELGR